MKALRISKESKLVHSRQPAAMGGRDLFLINALLGSLFNIFRTMMRLNIQAGNPHIKQGYTAKGEVSALVGMQADDIYGSVALSFTLPAVRAISLSLLGQEIDRLDDEAADIAGELANMMVGGAKRILSENGHEFDMQIPKLMLGKGHEIVHDYPGQTILLPIKLEQHEFYVELNFV